MKQPFVYIITNDRNTTQYIGVTSNIVQRIYQHKNKLIEGFSANYNLHKLIYFEQFNDMHNAILREKRQKKWNRDWKNQLINECNPCWVDLYPSLLRQVIVHTLVVVTRFPIKLGMTFLCCMLIVNFCCKLIVNFFACYTVVSSAKNTISFGQQQSPNCPKLQFNEGLARICQWHFLVDQ